MVLFVTPGPRVARPAFVAGRRVGGAVVRNRARRVMRAAWRGLASEVDDATNRVFVARPAILGATTQEIEAEMRALMSRTAGATP